MSTYVFILGKDAELSVAELYAVYPDALFEELGQDYLVMETPQKIGQSDFNHLGGVIKMAKLEAQGDREDLEQMVIESLLDGHESGKINYGVSLYGWPENNLKTVLIGLKKALKSAGVSSRFANQNFKNLTVAQKKGLKGPEIVITKSGGEFMVAKVEAVQDIDAYSKRDFKKPFRDMKVGMLPPKLAQILINLTGKNDIVWDPFCGGGVLVMEGMLMGKKILGSDINETTLIGAEKNTQWTKNTMYAQGSAKLFHHDARAPMHEYKFDAIAFEGYLGPPQTRLKAARQLKPVMAELDQLYIDFFRTLKKAKFNGPVVTGLPFFRSQEGDIGLDCVDTIQDMGFALEDLIPGKSLKSINYARADQLVGREILRFRLT